MKPRVISKMTADLRTHSIAGAAMLALLGLFSNASHAKTLYVNADTGVDATTKSANGPSSPWRTIGRASWGSTNRGTPNASEAAAAGDIVVVAGGTYTTTVEVNSRWAVVYNPVNSGTANNPITFICAGNCLIGAPNANGPIIGADGRNYVKWYADISQGHSWQINAYGRQSGSATATQVNTAPDTGPVVGHGAIGIWIEGAEIDGGLQTDYTDNWNAIRLENCTSCIIRNNSIRNFRNLGNTMNGTGVTLYGSANTIVEHNYVTNVGSAVIFKDTSFTLRQNNIRVRYNRFDGVDRCISWSTTDEDRNYVHQNLCMNAMFGMIITGGGLSNDWIFNNTFNNLASVGVYLASNSGTGGRFWNNIIVNADQMIVLDVVPMPADSVIDFEHNLYSAIRQFYSGSDGRRTFVDYKSAYRTQDQAVPASVDGSPLFVNPAGADFRLCTGVGVPASRCTGASPAIGLGVDIFDLNANGSTTDLIPAGAYVRNNEQIGPSTGGSQGAVVPSPPTDLTTD